MDFCDVHCTALQVRNVTDNENQNILIVYVNRMIYNLFNSFCHHQTNIMLYVLNLDI